MCGIFAYIGQFYNKTQLEESFELLKPRGPDNQKIIYKENILFKYNSISKFKNFFFGFSRLSINGLKNDSNQPLIYKTDTENVMLICNGEIYNYTSLAQKFDLKLNTHSDCEVILKLYLKVGIETTIQLLDGVFAFVLFDFNKQILYSARDPIGIRPLFMMTINTPNEQIPEILFSSELKPLIKLNKLYKETQTQIKQFPPNSFISSENFVFLSNITPLKYESPLFTSISPEIIREYLCKSVNKRIRKNNCERPIGLFISGGLDSSLIAALAQKYKLLKEQQRLHSFSIGIRPNNGEVNSPDLNYAVVVSNHINSIHHELIVTEDEAFNAIPDVIKAIESYDTTTVRASVPMYLLSKYISEKTDVKVMLSGEGSDEILGGYLYFHLTENPQDFQLETEKLVEELHFFDVLRADRCTAAHGLELRVPFLDVAFVKKMLSVQPNLKMPCFGSKIEKHILRQAFHSDTYPLIPKEVLWRKKDAFSDAVGYNWVEFIKKKVETLVSDDELNFFRNKTYSNKQLTKEDYYYRTLFDQYYPDQTNIIPRYWMPKWTSETNSDPSATALSIHKGYF